MTEIKPYASYKGFEINHPTRHIHGYGESYWYGSVRNSNDVITFKGSTMPEALQSFKDSVDDYLELTQEQNDMSDYSTAKQEYDRLVAEERAKEVNPEYLDNDFQIVSSGTKEVVTYKGFTAAINTQDGDLSVGKVHTPNGNWLTFYGDVENFYKCIDKYLDIDNDAYLNKRLEDIKLYKEGQEQNMNNNHEINQAKLAADQQTAEALLAQEHKQADIWRKLEPFYKPQGENPSQLLVTEETHTNEKGGKQSKLSVRFDLIPAYSLKIIAQILAVGAERYGIDNWKLIDTEDHINHAINHLYLFLSGDTTENHIGNACCRCLFALYSANHHE